MILSIPPTNPFCGLVIVLSNPSRFDMDSRSLLTGNAGIWVNDSLNQKDLDRTQCWVVTTEWILTKGWPAGTRAAILLGERALKLLSGLGESATVGKYRGYLLPHSAHPTIQNKQDFPMICSYSPQDTMDIVDHESRLNPLLKGLETDEEDEEDEDEKNHGPTKPANWRFWLRQDLFKISRINARGVSKYPDTTYHYFPRIEKITELLKQTKGVSLFLDIETLPPSLQCSCIGFGFDLKDIYVVPIIRFDWSLAYPVVYVVQFFIALAGAMCRNQTVVHNTMFDLFILLYHYLCHIGNNNYDTMLAFHRLFPEAEKSLGHCISWGNDSFYHKDSAVFFPKTPDQELKLWKYNGLDIREMMILKQAIDTYASSQIGIPDSIVEANNRIRPYLINTCQGIKYNHNEVKRMLGENDRYMTCYLALIKTLVGYDVLPSSPPQCIKYFHDALGYDVVGETATGNPSLAADNIYKLKLKYPDNPVLDLVIAFREKSKESGTLKFTPWIESCIPHTT